MMRLGGWTVSAEPNVRESVGHLDASVLYFARSPLEQVAIVIERLKNGSQVIAC